MSRPSSAASTPLHRDIIVACTLDGMMHGLDAESGFVLWSTPLSYPGSRHRDSLHLVKGTGLMIPSTDGNLHVPRSSGPYSTLSVKDVVVKTPFVTEDGRMFAGTTRSMALGLDYRTGQVRKVLDGGGNMVDYGTTSSGEKTKDKSGYQEDDQIVWVGRNDYEVSVYDAKTGEMQENVSSSDVLSSVEQLQHRSSQDSGGEGVRELYSAPSGTLAMVTDGSDQIKWLNVKNFDTPVVSAIDISKGSNLRVAIVSDSDRENDNVSTPRSPHQRALISKLPGANGSVYAIPLTTSDWIHNVRYTSSAKGKVAIGKTTTGKVVQGGLSKGVNNLVKTSSRRGSSHHQSLRAMSSFPQQSNACLPGLNASYPDCLIDGEIFIGSAGESDLMEDKLKSLLDFDSDKGPRQQYYNLHNHNNNRQHPSIYQKMVKGNDDALFSFTKAYDVRSDGNLNGIGAEKQYISTFKTLPALFASWLPPLIALLVVVGFELGRRRKLYDLSGSSLPGSNRQRKQAASEKEHPTNVGSIVLTSKILGYGGHGTVVFSGFLRGREVAVKRMLAAYDRSADNEIDLLVRTDSHPNLIRVSVVIVVVVVARPLAPRSRALCLITLTIKYSSLSFVCARFARISTS